MTWIQQQMRKHHWQTRTDVFADGYYWLFCKDKSCKMKCAIPKVYYEAAVAYEESLV